MVQLLHIPLICDHDTCSISISRHRQIRITSPYVKLSQLRSLGPAAHVSAFISGDACDTCVISSHASSGYYSLWQLPCDPCASYARCGLCPSPSPIPSPAIASFSYRRSDRSMCIVIARTSGVEIWLYPPGSLARETIAAVLRADQGVLVASLQASPLSVTTMAALQFQCETSGAGAEQQGQGKQAAVHFVAGYDDGSLREVHLDVWGDNVGSSVSCWALPPVRSATERLPVKFIRPWHHGSCMFVCAWADGCVQVFGSRGEEGLAYPVGEMYRLSPGAVSCLCPLRPPCFIALVRCAPHFYPSFLWAAAGSCLGSMCVSDGARVYITCANCLIFADLAELLDLTQFVDA
jgi:hypothetical protein